ncbi:MAG: ribitol-5-phosphate dehydrogenase, partial [Eubacteriaceae bacterium]|jgi:ribitol-5-phosphate 2-dehydrogenase|nr:ribitol-5-phosphate dehydrogenase [Eubacteriaceae bacterium]
VDSVFLSGSLPVGLACDHAFECAGGEGSASAIEEIIRTISPQGTVLLMGVTENKVPVATREVLEKGLVFVGCSRSGRDDFEAAIHAMQKPSVQGRLARIVSQSEDVQSIDSIHRVFREDLDNPFKTVFRWRM